MPTDSRWIELDGAVNVRDLGGLPAADGHTVQPNRLIRSDNLQGLTPADVRRLVDERQVRAVADLRTGVEVDAEGPGPLTREPAVRVEHFSLFPEAGRNTDAAALDEENTPQGPVVLPWQSRRSDPDGAPRKGAAAVYLGYLTDRADSAVAALRLIASSGGATIVHCAAGKDRTGVVTALALAEVGVPREEIVADYALSAERIGAIFGRLLASSTYAADLSGQEIDKHRPRAETMERLLDAIDNEHGGVPGWLRAHGWTDADGAALRSHLLTP
ncbi:MAG TPA: tyrosine-protein phosphatase [Jatrophihabitantaceae bacterium]|nr:tyrosine-protein phosphatase [Jatrophihabitantaceae bacterium]